MTVTLEYKEQLISIIHKYLPQATIFVRLISGSYMLLETIIHRVKTVKNT